MDRNHDLTSLGIWPEDAIRRLKAAWITTAEQVIAVAATTAGVQNLAEQTGLDNVKIEGLLQRSRAALPADVVSRLNKPADTSSFGMGALPRPYRKNNN